jgi:uncharacterized membrane protein YkvA (DUF1232 family)
MDFKRNDKLVLANVAMWLAQGLYTVSPIDLVPDFIPILGWMDDFLLFGLAVAFTIYTIEEILAL